MGFEDDPGFRPSDEPLPGALNPDVKALIAQALHDRPDLTALHLNSQALNRMPRRRSVCAIQP